MGTRVGEAAEAVRRRLGDLQPTVAIVLGSGLGSVADAVQSAIRIPQSTIPGFPQPTAPGHKGELIAGTLEGVPVLVQSGRFHLYEGHPPQVAALPVRVFARLGIHTLVITNAAGGIRPIFRPPTLMLIADHINLMFHNPLEGAVEEGEQRFPDMSDPYDRVRAFRVEHPPWAVRKVVSVDYAVDFGALYGAQWEFLNRSPPVSTILAVGSDVSVYPPHNPSHERSELAGDPRPRRQHLLV